MSNCTIGQIAYAVNKKEALPMLFQAWIKRANVMGDNRIEFAPTVI